MGVSLNLPTTYLPFFCRLLLFSIANPYMACMGILQKSRLWQVPPPPRACPLCTAEGVHTPGHVGPESMLLRHAPGACQATAKKGLLKGSMYPNSLYLGLKVAK